MRLPKQPREIEEIRRALAPYNFVPLPDRVITLSLDELPDQGVYDPKRLSGRLECELTTASPVFVRNRLTAKQFREGKEAKDQLEFFFLDNQNQPVIPGSSLRGMLRALVEVVSYSKVAPVSEIPLVYRAVGDTTSHGNAYRDRLMQNDGEQNRSKYYTPLIKGGYMEKDAHDDWCIRPAKEYAGTTYAHIRKDDSLFNRLRKIRGCRNAREIYIETGKYDYQRVRGGFLHIKFARVLRADPNSEPGLRRGTLAQSGWMHGKRTEAVIYEPDADADLLPLTDDQIELYREQISKEQEKILGRNGVLNVGQPVLYVLDENGTDVFFFGHSRMFRVPYPRSPRDYVPEALRRESDLDLAEAIFGYTKGQDVTKGKARTYAGRVFVSDAGLLPDQGDLWLAKNKTVTPKILAGPKSTTFQHYLVQTTPNRIKAGKTRDGRQKYRVELTDYAAPTPGKTVVRGHKFYWHKGAATLEDIREPGQVKADDTQHTKIQPLRPGVKFKFRINFENLSEAELGALLWVLNVAADEQYRLKIGMGKPLGMGAVSVAAKLHLIDRQARYGQLFADDDWEEAVEESSEKASAVAAAFERFVLDGLNVKNARRLRQLERIQALLNLLSWPGPDPEETRYLEIERPDPRSKRGKRNEYRGRPVLPPPFGGWIGKQAERDEVPVTRTPTSGPAPLPRGYKRGTVKDFGLGAKQSYGFIAPDGGGGDVFVHQNEVAAGVGTLQRGDRVIFKMGTGMRGKPQAQDVRQDK